MLEDTESLAPSQSSIETKRALFNYLQALNSFRKRSVYMFLLFLGGVLLVVVLVVISGVVNWKEGLERLSDVTASVPVGRNR
jgi:hypothetical protein